MSSDFVVSLRRAGGLAAVAICACGPAVAADLTEVVVTANRLPEPEDAVLAATTVITRQQIEARQARSIEDLLAGVEGIAISNSGGPGKLTSFFVRGADADQLLVLVDGVRIGSATAGTAALQNIPVELIERIEFVRGPRSSLYGADAIGGVLQIFTRRGGGNWHPELALSGGSFDTGQAQASIGGGSERAWLQAAGSWQHTDGIDACRGSSTEFAGCFAEEPDRDGYRYRSVSLRAGGEPAVGTSIEANLLRAASRVQYDGEDDEFYVSPNESHLLQQVLGLGLTQQLGARAGTLAVHAGRAWDTSNDFRDDTWISDFHTRRDSASLQWDAKPFVGQVLTLGADYQQDHVASSTAYTARSRDNTGLYAQYVADTGPWRLEASLRGDDNEQFGRHGTGSAAVGYALSDAVQLSAQYGTGFHAPTFNDLYYPGFGNAALDPERSRNLELAVRGRVAAARWRVSLFQNRIRDLIAYDANLNLPANIDAAHIRGLEASTTVPWRDWNLDAGLTLQDAENRSDDIDHGNRLARRPRVAGHLDLTRRIGIVTLGARWVGEGDRYDDAAETRRLAGYNTLDLRAEAAISTDWRLQVRAANLLDKHYETIAFYNQPGRAVYLTLRFSPGPAP